MLDTPVRSPFLDVPAPRVFAPTAKPEAERKSVDPGFTYKPVTVCELNAKTPTLSYAADPIYPRGFLIEIIGREKIGKTILSMQSALSVAAGLPILDYPTTQGDVIYNFLEDPPQIILQNIEKMTAGVPPEGFKVWTHPLSFEVLRQWKAYREYVMDIRPVLSVLDPLVELHGRDENDPVKMSALLRPIRKLARESGTTHLLVHHSNKTAGNPRNMGRGSVAIQGAVDGYYVLYDKEDYPGYFFLESFCRWMPKLTLTLRLDRDRLLWTTARPLTGKEQDVVNVIAEKMQEGAAWHDIENACGGLKATAFKALRGLKEKGLIAEGGIERHKRWTLKPTEQDPF